MTIKDVAKSCGVSVSTVSRVLNNRPDVSEEARLAVLSAVEELNYIPNNSARYLVRTRSDTVGMVVRGISNPFFSGIIKAVERCVDAAGYTLVMQQIDDRADEIQHAAVMEREKKLCGIIFLGGRSDYSPEDMAALNVPYVFCTYTNSFGSLGDRSYSSVCIEDEETAYRAVSKLIELGHTKIAALIASKHDRAISELRYLGYVRALREHGIEPSDSLVAEAGSFDISPAYGAMTQLIASGAEFTAVFAATDMMAIAALKALSEVERYVPYDCSVVGIDGLELSGYLLPTLSTYVQPAARMGEEAAEILLGLISGKGEHRHVRLGADFRPGGSVRELN